MGGPLVPPSLQARALGAIKYSLFSLKRGWNVCRRSPTISIVVDYESRCIEVQVLKSTTDKIIESLKNMFLTHGLPVTIPTDNGPQFASRKEKKSSKVCRKRVY